MRNIKNVTDNDMCLGCGACTYICPKNCINMNLDDAKFNVAKIDISQCIDCGLCKNVCPSINTLNYNGDFKGKESILIANSCKEKLELCQSGGAITTIVENMFKNKIIDGALLTKFNEKLKSNMELVTEINRVIDYAGSKYCSTDIKEGIKQLENFNGKVVVVGVPCQINAIKNIVKTNKKVKSDIIAYIGLVCDRVMSYDFIDYMSEKFLGKDDNHIVEFKYRSKLKNGWPGDIEIRTKKNTKVLSKKNRILLKPYFTMNRCYFCTLKSNPEADLVVGDPYNCHDLIPHNNFSTVIINTDIGNEMIKKISNINNLDIIKSSIERVRIGQNLEKKNKMAQSFKNSNIKIIRDIIGDSYINNINTSFKDKIIVLSLKIARKLSGTKFIRAIPKQILFFSTRVLNKITW